MKKKTDIVNLSHQIFIAILILSVSFCLAEILTRVFCPDSIVRAFTIPDEELGNVNRPNQRYYDTVGRKYYSYHVNTNEFGLRMSQAVDLSPQIRRILAVGGSTLFGWGVEIEDSYYDILRREAAQYGQIQLLNSGNGGYASGHVLKVLKRFSGMFEYEAVIYFMYGLDVRTNISANSTEMFSFSVIDGNVVLQEKKAYTPFKIALYKNKFYTWLNQHSYFFVRIKKLLLNNGNSTLLDGEEANSSEKNDAEDDLAVKVTMAHLTRLMDYCQREKLPLEIIWVPAHEELLHQVTVPPLYANFKMLLAAEVNHRKGVHFYDSTSVMADSLKESSYGHEDLYFSEGHFTKLGNRLYAASVKEPLALFYNSLLKNKQVQNG